MNIIGLLIISSLALTVNNEEYQTAMFKDEMKVQTFSFSQNEQYLVILQGFYNARGALINLPHYIYKKGEHGYQLVGKESYERVTRTQSNYNNYFKGEGKIQINSKGNIFVSIDNDNVVRVFQIKEGLTSELQYILPKSETKIFHFLLSYDGNYIVIVDTKLLIYKWDKSKFVLNSEVPLTFVDNIRISTGAQIIIGTNLKMQLNVYKRVRDYYQITSTKFPIKDIGQQGWNSIWNLGRSQDNGNYTVFSLFSISQSNKYRLELRYLQLNIKSTSLTYKQSFQTEVTQSYYLLTYLTRNGQYFAHANKNGQYVKLFGKKNGKYEFIYKFWNFTLGPSDIYVSQDGTFIAIANYFMTENEKYNKNGQQVAFFYKCNIANCLKCSWSKVCSQCDENSVKNGQTCLNFNNLESQHSQNDKMKGANDYQFQLALHAIIFSLILMLLFSIVWLAFYCFRRIFNYCGYQFDFGVRKKSSLNEEEEKVTQLSSQVNALKDKMNKSKIDFE